LILDEAHREAIGVEWARLLNKIAIREHISIVSEEVLRVGLLQDEEPVVGEYLGALRGVVEALALGGGPVLGKVDDARYRLSEGVRRRGVGLAVGRRGLER
jgi:hypothetical protein